MCVTVPVAPISRSPPSSETPIAIARTERPGSAWRVSAPPAPPTHRHEAGVAEHRATIRSTRAAARSRSSPAAWQSAGAVAPIWPAVAAGRPNACTSAGPSANGRDARSTPARTAVAGRSGVIGSSTRRLRRRRRAATCLGGRFDHLGDRRDAGDRFLRERADRIRDRADQPAVDVDRAAAHARRSRRSRRAARLRASPGSGCAAAPARSAARRGCGP